MNRTAPGRAASWLPVTIRLTAVGYLLFFVPDLILAATHHIDTLPPFFARLFNWGEGGDSVAVVFATVVWALFLFGSARAPLTNRLFLDFNLTANSAHFGAMLIMAVTMRDQHQHIAGVVALGLLTTVPLAACWLPVRRRRFPPHRNFRAICDEFQRLVASISARTSAAAAGQRPGLGRR
jgi:hypothetical protein